LLFILISPSSSFGIRFRETTCRIWVRKRFTVYILHFMRKQFVFQEQIGKILSKSSELTFCTDTRCQFVLYAQFFRDTLPIIVVNFIFTLKPGQSMFLRLRSIRVSFVIFMLTIRKRSTIMKEIIC